jgi:pyruvate formate lyase activating enzyme
MEREDLTRSNQGRFRWSYVITRVQIELTQIPMSDPHYPGRWHHMLEDGRMQCDLCPRDCRLHEGQRGACFVRQRVGSEMVLTTYGRSSGFCIDPVEKKPLNHFYPGSSILSFGTAGCNLACKFCQNWDISKSRDMDRLADEATPEAIAVAAKQYGCKSVAFTYNDPVIFAEYAMDIADACREQGIQAVAVTAGYIHADPRREFYAKMDAANVDLKAFTDEFYFKLCGARLNPVLDTLAYLEHETNVWFEITMLLIPGKNDSDEELLAECRWIRKELGPDVPVHFTAFHPDHKMTDIRATPAATLTRARRIAMDEGLNYVYTGNVHDKAGGSTHCPGCTRPLIVRDWHRIEDYRLTPAGACPDCGTALPGRFETFSRQFGRRRMPVMV